MKENEMAFLSQLAIGMFSMDKEGQIWRHRRLVSGSQRGSVPTEKILSIPIRAERSMSRGYPKVMFTVNGKRYSIYAHRVVWMIANQADIPPGLEINHKNGVRHDNRPENLEPMTPQENALHAGQVLKTLGKRDQRGGKNSTSKLTAQQVLEIRKLWSDGEANQTTIGKLYRISQATVSSIVCHKTWKHLP